MKKLNPTFIPRDNLVGEWLLDGNALDTAGSNDGTWGGTESYTTADRGYVKEVGVFDGSSDYINTNYSLNPTSVTSVSLWVRRTGAGSGGNAFEFMFGRSISNGRLYIGYNETAGTLGFGFGDKETITTDTGDTINDNEWYHIVGIWNSTTFTGYLNGVQVHTDTYTGDNNNINGFIGTININVSDIASTDYFKGEIGLTRVYNSLLSSDEIKELYQEGLRKLGPTNAIKSGNFPLYSLPNLEEGKILEISKPVNSGTYYDQSGNGNNGTNNLVTDSTDGLYNVMSFNGSSSYISIPYFDYGMDTGFTYSAWIYINNYDDNNGIIEHDYGGGACRGVLFRTTQTTGYLNMIRLDDTDSVVTNINSNIKVPLNTWTKVAITFDNTIGSKIYMNGNLVASDTVLTNTQVCNSSIEIGRLNPDGLNWMDGKMKNPIIYNRALSEIEIQQLYYSSKIV